jgi:GTP-binding protein HflX
MSELGLTFYAGGQVVKRFSQKMERPNPKHLGTGKIEESISM